MTIIWVPPKTSSKTINLSRDFSGETAGTIVLSHQGVLCNIAELVKSNDLAPTVQIDKLLVSLFEKHGSDMYTLLIGNLSFVLWDGVSRRLFIYLDRVGVNKYFYATDKHSNYYVSNSINNLSQG